MKIICPAQAIVYILLLLLPDYGLGQLRTVTVNLEVVTENAVPGGDGGNQWGGHQCRIVRTKDGVFTIYTAGGEDHFERRWHLMQRTASGWQELASDKSGREPVNLIAGPDSKLFIVGWPEYKGTIWSGKPENGKIALIADTIVAVYSGSHPYNAAGIDSVGNICVVSSVDDNTDGGRFQWAYYNAEKKLWYGRYTFLDYRHCYTYVFPLIDKSILLVSTRDVRWQILGYEQPPNTFAYVFNAFRYWKATDFDRPLEELVFMEEVPTAQFPFADCRAMNDVYLDSNENMHILYTRQGEGTEGIFKRFHAVYSTSGSVLYQAELPDTGGKYCRIFEDINHRYYLLDDSGLFYLLDKNGYQPIDSIRIDLQGYTVNYSGFGLTVPRTGTKPGRLMDVVFPSQNGTYYIYFELDLKEIFPVKP